MSMATGPSPAKPAVALGKGQQRPRSFFKDDFPYVRNASIGFGISLLVSAALIFGSDALLTQQQTAKKQAMAARKAARDKTNQLENEKREVQEFQPRYKQLIKEGLIGEEKRLDWIEQVRQIQESRKLLPMSYEMSPQQAFPVDPSITGDDLELRGSKIQLHMSLLHEMDLLNFLNDLRSKALYTTQACTIKPEAAIGNAPLASRLTADCTLYWITLRSKAAFAAETAKLEAAKAQAK
jgi:hypothetical protein